MKDKTIEALLRQSAADEQTIEQLIKLGGLQREVDPQCTERVRQRVFQVWLAKQSQNSPSPESPDRASGALRWNRRTWWGALGMAAMLWAGVVMVGLPRLLHVRGETVATVRSVMGTATANDVSFGSGSSLKTGDELSTDKSGAVVLALPNGSIVKIDKLTKLRFTGPEDIELFAGGIYFNSFNQGHIRIHTTRGVASDIGTEFETRLLENELLVRVREGKVRVDQAKTAVYVASGQVLRLAQGTARITNIAVDDEYWIWADAMDDDFSLTSRSMAEILVWLAHKEGWSLIYEDAADQQRARQDVIHGRLNVVDGAQLLRQLSLISDMQFQLKNKILSVSYPH